MSQSRWIYIAGGSGALLHLSVLLLGIAGALLITEERRSEFLLVATIIFTPFLLLPALLALYGLYRIRAPRLSVTMLITGIAGLLSFVAMPFFYLQSTTWAASDSNQLLFLLQNLWYALLLCNGFCLTIAGYTGIRTKTLPTSGLGVAGVVVGSALTVFMLCIFALSWVTPPWSNNIMQALTATLWISLLTYLLAQVVWAPWLGIWLLRQSRREHAHA
jgi:hypothetical protein